MCSSLLDKMVKIGQYSCNNCNGRDGCIGHNVYCFIMDKNGCKGPYGYNDCTEMTAKSISFSLFFVMAVVAVMNIFAVIAIIAVMAIIAVITALAVMVMIV